LAGLRANTFGRSIFKIVAGERGPHPGPLPEYRERGKDK
jgi:hypothetical protein